ncbi:MAG: hypothetical protein ACLPKE_36185 [Streptosporangiaceae bacterium]
MNPVTFSRRIGKLEYKAVRWPFSVLDGRVIARYWEQDALLRSGFRRFLGLLDRFAGWLLADDAIAQRGQDLLRRTWDAEPAPELDAEQLAPADQIAADQTAQEPGAKEPGAAEPAAMGSAATESVAPEAAIDEPPTEELTLAELAGPAVRDQAAEQLAAPAGPATVSPATVSPATVSMVDVTFTLPGEVGAGHVALCGDFNNWTAGNIALKRGGDGSWQTTVPLEPGHSYHYRYLLDGERWENAWQADRYEPNPFGSTNSVVIVGSPELALMS